MGRRRPGRIRSVRRYHPLVWRGCRWCGWCPEGAAISSEEFIKFQAEQEQLAAQHIELYMRYLKKDSRAGDIRADAEKANVAALQDKLDSIQREHGNAYIDSIQQRFDALKARHFDSSWNWVR